MNRFNTIKFKLTLWFCFLILLSSLSTILILNYAVAANRRRPVPLPNNTFTNQSRLVVPNDEFIKKIEEDRLQTQRSIFLASTFALLTQIVFAGFSSYYVIQRLLAPLTELTRLMQEVNEKVEYKELKFEDESEEILDLLNNFNAMMKRLQIAFNSQKQFVQNVSHEIKTPLTIIKTNLDLLVMSPDLNDTEQKEIINKVITSITHLNQLTEDFLLFSQIENKKFESKKFSLHLLISNLIEELSPLAQAKEIQISFDSKTKKTILGNPTLVKRAIQNIVENAIKYSPANSQISISTSLIDNQILLQIQDEGEGIPKKLRHKVFERFYRVDSSRTRTTGGSGLGLAISKEIIEAFSGKIEIMDSTKGTVIGITFPISSHNSL